jgi:hypothetical protein
MYEQYIRETAKWDAGPWRVSRRETAMIVIIVNFWWLDILRLEPDYEDLYLYTEEL